MHPCRPQAANLGLQGCLRNLRLVGGSPNHQGNLTANFLVREFAQLLARQTAAKFFVYFGDLARQNDLAVAENLTNIAQTLF